MSSNNGKGKYTKLNNSNNPIWKKNFLKENKWTTYLAYQLKLNSENSAETELKYEALLTQCCYLSRMAYSSADIFCRMTEHLDVTPNAFNNYIRAIEKIYQKLFDYKCSYDSQYIQDHPQYEKYFSKKIEIEKTNPVGFFIRNDKQLNVYLYVYDNVNSEFNKEKTLFISFKGSSSIQEFKENLLSAGWKDKPLSDLNVLQQSGSNGEVQSEETPLLANSNSASPEGKAGGGFIDVLKNSIQEIFQKITELKKTEFKRIIITGHSAGGVYATLFSYYLKRYQPNITEPIHLVTFGACCTFNAIARNKFNSFLNIEEGKSIFTLDRVTVFGDPIILLPADLDHPGFTLLKGTSDFRAFTKTGRTKEIGELRKMLELKGGFDGNDLLLSEKFVNLFTNKDDFKPGGKYDVNLYRSKFRIKFGTDAKEQRLVLNKAINSNNKKNKIKNLFKTIETETNKNIYKQSGGISFGKGLGEATDIYKETTKQKMPNEIEYSCYKIMSMGFCHGVYMGVTYMTVLRVPGITGGLKLKKEPLNNYTLYNHDGKVYSLSEKNYKNDHDCTKVISNVKNNSKNRIGNRNAKPKSFGNKMKNSFSGFTGLFKSKKKSNEEIELLEKEKEEQGEVQGEGQKSSTSSGLKCSIL